MLRFFFARRTPLSIDSACAEQRKAADRQSESHHMAIMWLLSRQLYLAGDSIIHYAHDEHWACIKTTSTFNFAPQWHKNQQRAHTKICLNWTDHWFWRYFAHNNSIGTAGHGASANFNYKFHMRNWHRNAPMRSSLCNKPTAWPAEQ